MIEKCTQLNVGAVLSMSVTEVALLLRATLAAATPGIILREAAFVASKFKAGRTVPRLFDSNAMTFIVSSWMFDWEAADFNQTPAAFDQGALVPIVSNIAPRRGGDGVNVYWSGPQAALEEFVQLLLY